ncbi:armadillo-type protein [Mycena sanguinolenta]|nr:armadillo-type protein [Mycena sanguinolenta]
MADPGIAQCDSNSLRAVRQLKGVVLTWRTLVGRESEGLRMFAVGDELRTEVTWQRETSARDEKDGLGWLFPSAYHVAGPGQCQGQNSKSLRRDGREDDGGKGRKKRHVSTWTIPSFLKALRHSETNTWVAALQTCATLAQDVTSRDIVTRAAPQITACVADLDDDAFRLTIAGAASQVLSQLNSLDWEIRLQALRTLSAFAENDAFGDIISSFFQRIVECMKDDDDEVRVQVSRTLLSLVEHSAYRPSIRGALQDCGKSHVVDLASDPLKHVRVAALPLIQKVVELDAFPDSVQEIMATIVNHLSDGDDEHLLVYILPAATYAKELTTHIDKLIGLLKHDGSNSTVPTTVLSILSVLVRQDSENFVSHVWEKANRSSHAAESVDIVVQTMTTVFSDFEDTTEPQFWDAATEFLLALAGLGSAREGVDAFQLARSPVGVVCVGVTLSPNTVFTILLIFSAEAFQLQFQTARPIVIKLVESADLDVRLSAIRVAGPLVDELDLDEEHMEIFSAAMQQFWRDIVVDMKSPNPSAVGFERLSELSDNDFFDGQFTDLIPLIVTALKGQHQTATWLHLLSKLAAARAS